MRKLTNEEFNIFDYSLVTYTNAHKKVKIICKKHGSFEQTPNKHLSGDGCKFCCSSKGELKIKSILESKNIEHKTQYTFKDLIFKKRLKFDFAIFHNSYLKFLIEFNGQQHYEYCERFHRNNNEFENCIIRDNLKIEYCKNNKIKLYIIRYDENINESIDKILNEYEQEIFK